MPHKSNSQENERAYHQYELREAALNRYPFYCPRFWHGMGPRAWRDLLRMGKFRVSPSRIPMAFAITIATFVNVLLSWLERAVYWRRLRDAKLEGPPIFIIGHWRSGTTMLHELLVRDERFSSPSTYQCFAPSHFLISEWAFRKFGRWLLPGKRPMDNMKAGWERPQEDEFALVNLGLPSPYRRIAFPLQGAVDLDYLDFEGVSKQKQKDWTETLRGFLHRVTIATGRPLVIKSPTHTGRIQQLAEAFPHAKFIHLTREPRDLFPSTCRLWSSLDEVQALQAVGDRQNDPAMQDYVLSCLEKMYRSLDRALQDETKRRHFDSSHFIEIKYERLVEDPVATLRQIYQQLRLADFELVASDFETWVEEEHRGYQRNQHHLDPEIDARLVEQWEAYFKTYDYSLTPNE